MTASRESIERIITQHLGESVLVLKERYLEGANLSAIQKMSVHAWRVTFGFDDGQTFTISGKNDGNGTESVEVTATQMRQLKNEIAHIEVSIPPKPSGQPVAELSEIANSLHVISESYQNLSGSGEVTLLASKSAE